MPQPLTPPAGAASATVCVFDAYGTLFDVAAAARNLAAQPGKESFARIWPRLSEIWRAKQLQYTWLRAAAGVHADFWTVTAQALDYAIEAVGPEAAPEREALLALYRRLDAYPEAPAALRALRAAGLRTAILSNGTPDMLADAVESAGMADLLDATLSVESVGVFKPAPAAYALVERHFGVPAGQVLFLSSNGWDAAGAAGYGFRAAWVNRAGDPVERLPWRPAAILRDLSGVPALAGVA
ncbi:haloacid dehalogenase type II [Oceanicella actignis]|uniref:(S)-2-haloacid dehalogenase n=1 Tax=Oceanicella actignis TaxID=1189325 RepID=A0A1M7TF39_9RHOB|nr:haloacid dehalogenase type II [Oceanicella actignis]SET61545.1 2-haloacid dehalogenase [Oceanicella actignis]SHN69325.1 2-haloacid dehalogenase [Oceanicella actignis]